MSKRVTKRKPPKPRAEGAIQKIVYLPAATVEALQAEMRDAGHKSFSGWVASILNRHVAKELGNG